MKKLSMRDLVFVIVSLLIGSIMVSPIQAKVSKLTLKWLKKNYYSKRQLKKNYYSKKQSNSKYQTKSQSDASLANYYNKTSIDTLLADYLKSTVASSTYLTQSNAASTYLTQANASSTYLTPSTANSSYVSKSGDTVTGALTATGYNYSTPQTRYLNIPGAAFRGVANPISSTSFEANKYRGDAIGNTATYAVAPIYLPDGATINQVLFYHYTNNSTPQMNLYVYRYGINNDTPETIAEAFVNGAQDALRNIEGPVDTSKAAVDNMNYSYYAQVRFWENNNLQKLRMVRIAYTVPSAD